MVVMVMVTIPAENRRHAILVPNADREDAIIVGTKNEKGQPLRGCPFYLPLFIISI